MLWLICATKMLGYQYKLSILFIAAISSVQYQSYRSHFQSLSSNSEFSFSYRDQIQSFKSLFSFRFKTYPKLLIICEWEVILSPSSNFHHYPKIISVYFSTKFYQMFHTLKWLTNLASIIMFWTYCSSFFISLMMPKYCPFNYIPILELIQWISIWRQWSCWLLGSDLQNTRCVKMYCYGLYVGKSVHFPPPTQNS